MNNKWPPGSHVFQQTGTIFELVQDNIGTNLLTKFHEDPTINVASTVLTRQIFMTHNGRQTIDKRLNKGKTAPPPGGHVFSPIMTIFKLVRDIYKIDTKNVTSRKTHVLTKFHEDWTKNVTSRVFTRVGTNRPPPSFTVFKPIQVRTDRQTLAQTDQQTDQPTNQQTGQKQYVPHYYSIDRRPSQYSIDRSICQPWCSHVFHYMHIEKTSPPPGGHVFPPIWTIFELVLDINETNVLNKFYDDWAKIVTSRVFTRNTDPSLLHEDWASKMTSTVFELSPGINRTNVLTKFHEDRTINVASRVFTRQNVDDARRTTHDGQKVITKAHHEHVVLR
ncbi:hypothetical protein DPMN_036691 [Dreissena polymorpha]|uniref:Uncharacterized protein n=1 Tax=Dreissena polymorpha TaxID=45954 RepID=A0A9D4MBZ2_DREPO|nr:hypothetical protein DPMN_036691 [Dreissena polymorpha]